MKEPKQLVLEFINKKLQKEKDKWESGMKNDLYAWEFYADDFAKTSHEIENNKRERAELVIANARFQQELQIQYNEIEKLRGQIAEYHAVLQSQKQEIENLQKRLERYK